MQYPHFSAAIIRGAGRGKPLGSPTLNLDIEAIPAQIEEGIYAALVTIDDYKYPAAIHYGPQLFFEGGKTFEVHLIDESLSEAPESIGITLLSRLRDVKNFPSEAALKEQISMDIEESRDILAKL